MARRVFRRVSSDSLEHIHSDLVVETCLKLFHTETDEFIRSDLAHALLFQFSHEGIELARQLLIGKELDFEGKGLRSYLLETCSLMAEQF